MSRTMSFLVCCALFLFSGLGLNTAEAQKHMRIASYAFPNQGGNPFAGTTAPSTMILPAFYDALTLIRSNGALEPQLAIEWERIDELTWQFELRDGVLYSNGEPFDAKSVTTAVEYLLSEDGANTAVGRELSAIVGATATGPNTVQITTAYPVPRLPFLLAALRPPAPQHWLTHGPSGSLEQPIGTGPFKVKTWQAANIEAVANATAWRVPKIDRLSFIFLPDQAARLQALLSGAVDIATSLGPEDEPAITTSGGVFLSYTTPGNIMIALISVKEGPIADKRVRQALNYAVNKDVIIDVLLKGSTNVASQMVPENVFGFNPDLMPYPYDPEKARSLLAEAGYPNGFDMTIEVPVGAGVALDAWHQQIASDLRTIGVEAKLQQIQASQLVQRIYSGAWIGDAFTMSMDTAPSLDALRPFRLHSCLWARPWYCDPSDTSLIEAAGMETNVAKLESQLFDLMRRYHDDPPGIYLFQMMGFTGLSGDVRNFRSDLSIYPFHELDLDGL